MSLDSKAKTIEFLNGKTNLSKVLPLVRFSVQEFKKNSNLYITRIQDNFKDDLLIVRSSSLNEDTEHSSNAGHFESVLNVNTNDKKALRNSINKVISSFNKNPLNEVFVQPMLKDMTKCGVGFTADIDTLAPYYIINFDDSGSPDVITSGKNGNIRTYVHLKGSNYKVEDPLIQKLILAFNELEKLFKNSTLDIEFGINSDNEIFIFQVRPIVVIGKKNYLISH